MLTKVTTSVLSVPEVAVALATDTTPGSINTTKANVVSPIFTGIPTAPTAAANTNTTQLATTAFVMSHAGTAGPTGPQGPIGLTGPQGPTGTSGDFVAGTRLTFAQAGAPTGWVIDATMNNRMLRVVSSNGGTVGGLHDPTVLSSANVPSHTHSFTTGNNSVSHTHSYAGPGWSVAGAMGSQVSVFGGANSNSYTTGAASTTHTHAGSTDANAGAANWQPYYLNIIVCTKS